MGRQLLRLGGGRCVLPGGMGAAGPGTGPGLTLHSPQLTALCYPGAPPAQPSPTTLCQWGRSGKKVTVALGWATAWAPTSLPPPTGVPLLVQ